MRLVSWLIFSGVIGPFSLCDEIWNEMKSMSIKDFIGENTHNRRNFGVNSIVSAEMTETGDD